MTKPDMDDLVHEDDGPARDRLLREVKRYAAERGRTLTSVLEDALRQFLSGTAGASPAEPSA